MLSTMRYIFVNEVTQSQNFKFNCRLDCVCIPKLLRKFTRFKMSLYENNIFIYNGNMFILIPKYLESY